MKYLVLLLFVSGVALAQDVPGLPSLDPSKLGGDVFALGGVLLFVTQFIKRQCEQSGRPLNRWVTLGLTFALAEAASAGLYYAKFGASYGNLTPPWGWIVFGALAAGVAAGFRDWVVALIERRNTAPIAFPVDQWREILPPAGVIGDSSIGGLQPVHVSGDEALR